LSRQIAVINVVRNVNVNQGYTTLIRANPLAIPPRSSAWNHALTNSPAAAASAENDK
jgi:hypothetical protein